MTVRVTSEALDPRQQAVPDAEDEDLIIRPGEPRPFFVPWCASCGMGVEKFTIDPVTSHLRMGVQATCHGATEGIWVSVDALFARKRLNQPIILFRKDAGFNRVR